MKRAPRRRLILGVDGQGDAADLRRDGKQGRRRGRRIFQKVEHAHGIPPRKRDALRLLGHIARGGQDGAHDEAGHVQPFMGGGGEKPLFAASLPLRDTPAYGRSPANAAFTTPSTDS